MMVKVFLGLIAIGGIIVFTGGFTHADSLLELNPPRVVVRYGDSVSVNCSTSSTDHDGMGWEATVGATGLVEGVSFVTWTVENVTDWNAEPKCFINPSDGTQHLVTLQATLYKPPASVSISPHTGPMVEGTEYQLSCDVLNAAPVQNLTVIWYKGNEAVMRNSYDDRIKTPVNTTSILTITPSRHDDGAQYRCEAQLDLGPDGPEPPPTVTSEPVELSVFYPPTFLSPDPETLVLGKGDEVSLNCTATGNPVPVYSWQTSQPQEKMGDQPVFTSSSTLAGTYLYNCTASNENGKTAKQFIVNRKGGRATYWIIIGVGVGLMLLILGVYVIIKRKTASEVY